MRLLQDCTHSACSAARTSPYGVWTLPNGCSRTQALYAPAPFSRISIPATSSQSSSILWTWCAEYTVVHIHWTYSCTYCTRAVHQICNGLITCHLLVISSKITGKVLKIINYRLTQLLPLAPILIIILLNRTWTRSKISTDRAHYHQFYLSLLYAENMNQKGLESWNFFKIIQIETWWKQLHHH